MRAGSDTKIIHGNRYISEFGEAVKRFAEPAVVTDGSGFAARLMVLPTFGCALHEPKDRMTDADDETENDT